MKTSLVYLLLFCALLPPLFGQVKDSLLAQLDGTEGTARIEILHQLVISVWLNYPDQAQSYGEEALEIAEASKDDLNISKSLRLLAGVYYYRGDYDISLDFNIRALDLALVLGDSSLINNGYNNIGLLYYHLGSYQTALEYLLRAKEIKLKIKELYGLPTTLINIGMIYERVGDFETARAHFLQAYDRAIEGNYKDQEIYSQNNIGNTYLRQRQYDEARKCFEKALKLALETENINWGSVSLRRIGEIEHAEGHYDSATYYFNRSLTDSRGIDDKNGISEVLYLMAKLSLDKGFPRIALEHLDNSQQLAIQLKLRHQMLENHKLYALIYQKTDDVENIILSQANYSDLRDSLFQDAVVRNLTLIPLKIKEEEDRLKLARQKAEIEQKGFRNVLYVIILLSAIPLIVFLIILVRKNIKANRILREKHEELKLTHNMLITSEKMASLGVLASGIGHEINNPLNFIKNGSEALAVQLNSLSKTSGELYKPYFDAINEGVQRASNVVKSLSHFSKVGVDMNESCDINQILENCLIILSSKIRLKADLIKDYSALPLFVLGNEGKLHQAFMNIIANAEQAIQNRGTINIQTRLIDDKINVQIKDDGEGIAQEHLAKISDPFFTTKAPGIGTGLGLFITYSIIEEHHGTINVISVPNVETKFSVYLPEYRN